MVAITIKRLGTSSVWNLLQYLWYTYINQFNVVQVIDGSYSFYQPTLWCQHVHGQQGVWRHVVEFGSRTRGITVVHSESDLGLKHIAVEAVWKQENK